MISDITVEAKLRNQTGSADARRIRRQGLIPATVYGDHKEPLSVAVDAKQITLILRSESGHNTIFKLQPPDAQGRFSDAASHNNYRYALTVVDPAQPESSLILIKPTRPTDSSADANIYLATHNGGQRWPGNEASAEYRVVLDWIRGARLPAR